MATVIDSLVVTLGLDASNFTKEQKAALDQAKKMEEELAKRGRGVEKSSSDALNSLGNLATKTLGLFGVATSAAGIISFVKGTVEAGAQVGILSRNINVSSEEIQRFANLAETSGGSAEGMAQSFKHLSDVFVGWEHGRADPLIAVFNNINAAAATLDKSAKTINPKQGINQYLMDLAANLKIIREHKPELAGLFQSDLGLDPGLFDRMIDGPEKFAEALARTKVLTKAEIEEARKLNQEWGTLTNSIGTWFKSKAIAAAGFPGFFDRTFGTNLTGHRGWGDYSTPTPAAAAPSSGGGSSPMDKYAAAIAAVESRGSGGYSALGPATRSGDRAYGKYQVMGNNIGEWSQEALGRRITPQEFLASPEMQDAIFKHKFGQYVKKYGNPQDAASAWFTGGPLSTGANKQDGLGTSGLGYVGKFNAALAGGGGSSNSVSVGQIVVHTQPGADGNQIGSDITAKLRSLQATNASLAGGSQ